jgi:tether containing UBX domain for GLUT4
VVSVALQVADLQEVPGGRLIDKFQSTTTLWLILRKFESNGGLNLNFTSRGVAQADNGTSGAGRIFYETPVLNISGREVSSFGDLQKTLAQLGFNSGSVMIRLSFKRTETPLEVATQEISEYFKSDEAEDGANATTGATTSHHVPDLEPTDSATEAQQIPSTAMDVDKPTESSGQLEPATITATTQSTPSESPSTSQVLLGPNKRPISVFAPPSGDTPKAALQPHNEDDYEPTIAHAKLHQSNLLNKSQNKRLLSDAELEQQAKEKAAKQAAIKEVSVKIRFPDQSSIVLNFNATDTGASLYTDARDAIVFKGEPFSLVWSSHKGPQTVPDSAKITLINGLGFSERMLVNFIWGDKASDAARKETVLTAELASKAQELRIQEVAAVAVEDDKMATEPKPSGKEKEGGGKNKGIPKWLKLPGKK